VGAQLIYVEII